MEAEHLVHVRRQLCLIYLDQAEDAARRLFVLSAGNVAPDRLDANHLDRSDVEAVRKLGTH